MPPAAAATASGPPPRGAGPSAAAAPPPPPLASSSATGGSGARCGGRRPRRGGAAVAAAAAAAAATAPSVAPSAGAPSSHLPRPPPPPPPPLGTRGDWLPSATAHDSVSGRGGARRRPPPPEREAPLLPQLLLPPPQPPPPPGRASPTRRDWPASLTTVTHDSVSPRGGAPHPPLAARGACLLLCYAARKYTRLLEQCPSWTEQLNRTGKWVSSDDMLVQRCPCPRPAPPRFPYTSKTAFKGSRVLTWCTLTQSPRSMSHSRLPPPRSRSRLPPPYGST